MKKLTIISTSLLFGLVLIANAAEVILTPVSSSTKKTTATAVVEDVFTRVLTVGSSGQDVMALKKILNLELKSAIDGTATFSSKTESDVKSLQEKYPIEILIPNGLSAGTGKVGAATITKLNQLAVKYSVKLSDFTVPSVKTAVITAFMSTLQLGSKGDEVVLLKNVLNSDPATALNPKNSTNIFDAATAVAVKKFQEKYASEILKPSGLTVGTGIVGASTRKKLNALLNSKLATQGGATSSSQTSVNYQKFTDSGSYGSYGSYNPSSGSSFGAKTDGDSLSTICDGTTLVTTKSGFGSTYETRTTNSPQCGAQGYVPPADTSSYYGVCTKKTFTVGAWSDCKESSAPSMDFNMENDGIQTRTVTYETSTTTCPYFNSTPASTRSCRIPDCPGDQKISIVGVVKTWAGCRITPWTSFTLKSGAQFSTQDGKACKIRVSAEEEGPFFLYPQIWPFFIGMNIGLGQYFNTIGTLNMLGDLSTTKSWCSSGTNANREDRIFVGKFSY